MRRPVLLLFVVSLGCAHVSGRPAAPGAGEGDKRLTFAILEDYDKGADLERVAADFAAMRALGITTWRGSFGWDDYEPSPGVYDFTWLRAFVALAKTQGIELRPYLAYTPAWAARGTGDTEVWNDPPKDPAAFERFVYALVTALSEYDNVRSYEIYNEENVPQWWDGTPEDYADVLARGIRAVRAADADAEVLFGGMVYPDTRFIEAVCGAGEQARGFDILPFHAYPETWERERVEDYLGHGFGGFVGEAFAACGRKPIWINEAGVSTTQGRDERAQAAWWVRAVASFAAEPAIEHIGIYELRDLAPGSAVIGDEHNYHLGLLRVDGTRKLAFATVRMLAGLLGSRAAHERVRLLDAELEVRGETPEDGLHQHLFRRSDGGYVLVLWSETRPFELELGLPIRTAGVIEYGLDGSARPSAPVTNRTFMVRLDAGYPRVFELVPIE